MYCKVELELVCVEVGGVEFSGELWKVEETAIYYVERNLVFVFEGKVGKFALPDDSLIQDYQLLR